LDLDHPETIENLRSVFFPEGRGLSRNSVAAVHELRVKRTVVIHALNPDPIRAPHREVLFTANVLLTVPPILEQVQSNLSRVVADALEQVIGEDQAFWYDHPIPVGIETEKNEAVYGLRGLDESVRFEIQRGTTPSSVRIPVLLSISTTHHGLQAVARPWLREELQKGGALRYLDLYAVSEKDVQDILEEVLFPAAAIYCSGKDTGVLKEVLGVDGEYGRHYSFLKAIAALWHVLIDSGVRATFKIDLDQVFPQDVLVSETGRSAFEHLSDPLWGAEGWDTEGKAVRLGMLAGALVNEGDIRSGLFTPDVKWPPASPENDRLIFDSELPQALSTLAEMMTRYNNGHLDGIKTCLQRIHVTGGTTGILVDDLRRYRPFTPSWIGRAEDQAYLMSVLYSEEGPTLRYGHASGLFMRHDKKTFAADAIEVARIGKMVGDYIRIMVFSSYARILPWSIDRIKSSVDPFTGCFISRIPITVSALRLALKAAYLFGTDSEESKQEGEDLISMGCARLAETIKVVEDVDFVAEENLRNKAGWDLYYDTLDALENGLENGDPFAEKIRQKVRELVDRWRI
jgi:hypothetical protein